MKRLLFACILLFGSSAFAATNIVQSSVVTTFAAGGTCAITFTTSMIRWNTVIFWVAAAGNTSAAATSATPNDGGNTYTLIHGPDLLIAAGYLNNIYSWYSVIQVPGQHTITATLTGATGALCGAMELSGLGSTPTAHFWNFQTFNSLTSWSAGSGIPAAGDFAFSYGGNTIGQSIIASVGAGWTLDQQYANYGQMSFQEYVMSAPGGFITPTASLSTAPASGFMGFISISPGGPIRQRPTGKSGIF